MALPLLAVAALVPFVFGGGVAVTHEIKKAVQPQARNVPVAAENNNLNQQGGSEISVSGLYEYFKSKVNPQVATNTGYKPDVKDLALVGLSSYIIWSLVRRAF
jgi:hypothetical protein